MAEDIQLAELVATLSYAADLGLGQPMEHCMRQAAIALRIGDLLGVNDSERTATYYLGLLMNTYCHADAAEQASWFGDDIEFKAVGIETFNMDTAQTVMYLVRRLASHGTGVQRIKRLATFPFGGAKRVNEFLTTHSTLAANFAGQLGLGEEVTRALRQAYEQWDGKGQPASLSGDQISRAARLVQIASPVEVFSRLHGVEAARAMVRRNRGGAFDPAIVDTFCDNAQAIVEDLAGDWDAILAAEPGLSRAVSGAELDAVLEAMADLVDLKSPFMAGHSRGVANLAAEAGRVGGLTDSATLRTAGLLHDLGRLGVANTIWDKPAPLSAAERERVNLHPYLTDRMLARIRGLNRAREIAARHHERLDGSGYPHGLTAAVLTPHDRILAAADVYHAMTEPRPHRPPLEADQAARELRAEVRAGRLDGDAADAVLKAAGHRLTAKRGWPAGLTSREVEVLVLLARGRANKQIAQSLGVTPKTVSNHIEHIYVKLGVSSRAAATLFATRHGLLGAYEPA